MKILYSDSHRQHRPQSEFNRGQLVVPFERPERADQIVDTLRNLSLGELEKPAEFPLAPILRVHAPPFVEFLQSAYAQWVGDGRTGDALPIVWPIRGLRDDRVPESITGRLSYYSFDVMTPITPGTWTAVKGAVDTALTAARYLSSGQEQSAFALCRPPGHHAASTYFGGYCFLNNAAIAAQYLLDQGAARIAILDVDYHHGNGTQEIFYSRNDVLYVSVHADPKTDFPYFLGYADETGQGPGAGFNLNIPLPRGTDWARWSEAYQLARTAVQRFAPDVLVVSLGVDTFEGDELSAFRLKSADFLRMGELLAAIGKPTLFILEGGYAYQHIGLNVANVLSAFEGAAQ